MRSEHAHVPVSTPEHEVDTLVIFFLQEGKKRLQLREAPALNATGIALSGLDFMRVVTYPLYRIMTLLERLAEDPGVTENLIKDSDAHLQERMEHG